MDKYCPSVSANLRFLCKKWDERFQVHSLEALQSVIIRTDYNPLELGHKKCPAACQAVQLFGILDNHFNLCCNGKFMLGVK